MPRKIVVREAAVPLAEVTLSKGGDKVLVALWREAALQSLAVGEWIKLTHVRGASHPDYGFKYHSTSNTEILVSFLMCVIALQTGRVLLLCRLLHYFSMTINMFCGFDEMPLLNPKYLFILWSPLVLDFSALSHLHFLLNDSCVLSCPLQSCNWVSCLSK